jgi:hypothetical protein
VQVRGVLLSPDECLRLAVLADRVVRHDRALLADLGLAELLADVNAVALDERRRRAEADWQASLVPITEASARLGVPARTLRARAQRGSIASTKDEHGRWLVEAA